MPRRARYLVPRGLPRRDEVLAACVVAVVLVHLLFAQLTIVIAAVLYLSENIYVESGDYRHELILYRLAAVRGGPHGTPSDPRMHEWHRPGETPGPLLMMEKATSITSS